MEKSLTASYDPQRPVALPKTLGILRRGLGDPTIRLSQTEAWLAFATPLGDATLHIHKPSPSSPAALQAWGPGAQWAMESAPNLLGAKDDWTDFDAAYAQTDWSKYKDMPAFASNNRGNAYRIYLELEQSQFKGDNK